MFRFWFRELAGWLLIALGLFLFYEIYVRLTPARGSEFILEAPVLAVVGIFVFRGGIHLLKVSIAARIALSAKDETQKLPADKPAAKADPRLDW
jgi:hypothetical protein